MNTYIYEVNSHRNMNTKTACNEQLQLKCLNVLKVVHSIKIEVDFSIYIANICKRKALTMNEYQNILHCYLQRNVNRLVLQYLNITQLTF